MSHRSVINVTYLSPRALRPHQDVRFRNWLKDKAPAFVHELLETPLPEREPGITSYRGEATSDTSKIVVTVATQEHLPEGGMLVDLAAHLILDKALEKLHQYDLEDSQGFHHVRVAHAIPEDFGARYPREDADAPATRWKPAAVEVQMTF